MLYTPNILPGYGFKKFAVCRQETTVTETGRPMESGYIRTATELYGILALTTPEERAKWKQDGHDVSHRIVQHACMVCAKATDILLSEDGRCFRIAVEPRNPGGFNATVIYYVDERNDMHEFIK